MAIIRPDQSSGSPSGGGGNGLPATFVTKTANYTAAGGDFVLGNVSGGGFTVTLPSNPAVGTLVTVQKTDTSGNTLTIVASGGGTINGDASATTTVQWAGGVFEHVGSDAWRLTAVMTTSGPAGPTGATGATGPTGPAGAGEPPYMVAGMIGRWYLSSAASLASNNGVQFVNGVLNMGTPMICDFDVTIDDVGIFIVTPAGSAGAVVRVGIYQITTAHPYNPVFGSTYATLLKDVGASDGTIVATSTGVKTQTLATPLLIAAGTPFALGHVTQGAPATLPSINVEQAANVLAGSPFGNTTIANLANFSVQQTGVTGALGASFVPSQVGSAGFGTGAWFRRSA